MSSKTPASDLIVVGGGAAGFFGAINVVETNPKIRVLILEKSGKLLSKVRVSGGGRCNVTHHCFDPKLLASHYPRGERELRNLFRRFQARDTIEWFSRHGVPLKSEGDGRVFPVSDSSQSIIDCFRQAADKGSVQVLTGMEVTGVQSLQDQTWQVECGDQLFTTKKLLIASGGYPQAGSYRWLQRLQPISQPIPSLFTFNDSERSFTELMGVAVPQASIKIEGTKLETSGAILITHWGLSGPAVLKLSAWAAEELNKRNYLFTALVNWAGSMKEDELRSWLKSYQQQHFRKGVISNPLFDLPMRLWDRLCTRAGIDEAKKWGELSNHLMNRLIEQLTRCRFQIKGKTTFKEEFVTCGGILLSELNLSTMESKTHTGLYFAGEVLNIDGETGGFNFQSAWTTAYVAAESIVRSLGGST